MTPALSLRSLRALTQPPLVYWCVAATSLSAVGTAVFAQHVLGHEPCPWCVLQRVVFVAMALVAVIGAVSSFLMRSVLAQRVALAGLVVLALCGSAASLWQHFVAASSQTCNLTLADKIIHGMELDTVLPEVFEPRASCADAVFYLFGLPYEVWALMLYVALGAATLLALRQSLRGRD